MTSEVDGGIVAIEGFVIQSMSALLDVFGDANIDHLTIEPMSEDGAYQKVDYLVRYTNGQTRLVQVKHSKNAVGPSKAKKWASSLRRTSPKADQYELQLYAPATGSLAALSMFDGVRISRETGDKDKLWDATCFRAHKYVVSARGHYSPRAIELACRAFVGETIVQAAEARVWTRAQLLAAFLAEVTAKQALLSNDVGAEYDVELRRIVIAHENGTCDDHVKYSWTSRRPSSEAAKICIVTWTDADHVDILSVSDGLSGNPAFWKVKDQNGSIEVQVQPRWILEPSETGCIYITVRRGPALRRLGPNKWIYTDPLLRGSGDGYPAEVMLRFPFRGTIESPDAITNDGQHVRWCSFIGTEQKDTTAMMTVRKVPRKRNDLHSLISEALKEHTSPEDGSLI